MTEPFNPRAFAKMLVALAVFGLLGYLVWPHVKQSESQIVLVGSAVTIALAFYSIFDLQKKRDEKFSHTLDRLVRAAFLAMTLVFVVEIATKPAPERLPGETKIVYEKLPFVLADDLNELKTPWTDDAVRPVIEKHFKKLSRESAARTRIGIGTGAIEFTIESGGTIGTLRVN